MKKESREVVRVCKDIFLKSLCLGRSRVENIAKHSFLKCGLRTEKRGGDTKGVRYGNNRQSVHNFMKSLRARESHYDRTKTRKLYLPPCITSITSLWELYTIHNSTRPVKYEFFRRIFRRDFRIGFGSPKTDAWSLCERLKNQIKVEADPLKKQTLMTDLRIHTLRANVFYVKIERSKSNFKQAHRPCRGNRLPTLSTTLSIYARE